MTKYFLFLDASDGTILAAVSKASFQFVRKCAAIVDAFGVWLRAQMPTFELRDFLPISIDITRGAVVVGNDSTHTILIGGFNRADGTFGTTPVRIYVSFCAE